jgi:hypothetical protein
MHLPKWICAGLGHQWHSCICPRCGGERHNWNGCICTVCRDYRHVLNQTQQEIGKTEAEITNFHGSGKRQLSIYERQLQCSQCSVVEIYVVEEQVCEVCRGSGDDYSSTSYPDGKSGHSCGPEWDPCPSCSGGIIETRRQP